jgi:putative heme-binding domain-containing protein
VCVACHKIGNEGGEIGPALTGVGTKYDRAFLTDSILFPSKQILDGYHQTIVRLKDGGRIGDAVLPAAADRHRLDS